MDVIMDYTPLGLLLKARNQAIDAVFYDVGSLTFQEWLSLNPTTDKKGKIVVVSPSDSPARPIRHYQSAEEFLVSDDWRSVVAVAVAGVGSSVIGTAALARNVADACDGDVAGVVSGYGVSDAVLEGLGGWYFYGKVDQLRYTVSNALDDLSAIISKSFAKGTDVKEYLGKYFDLRVDDYVPPDPDVMALYSILLNRYLHQNTNLRLLVGHSKGNLLISDVLNHLRRALSSDEMGMHQPFHNLAVVTLGAVVDLPKDMILEENQYQFLGTLDALGYANSRSIGGDLAPRERIPGTWHSLNSRFPGHMDAIELLKNRVKLPPRPEPARQDGEDLVALERRNRLAAAVTAKAGSLAGSARAMAVRN